MIRYLKVLIKLFWVSQIDFLEYRANFVLTWLGDALSGFIALALYSVIYSKTQSIAGWTQGEVYLILAVFNYMEAFIYFIYAESIRSIPRLIPRGDLDSYLTKPIDFQFIMSFFQISPASLGPLIPAIVLTVLGFHQLRSVNPYTISIFLILIAVAVLIHYSLHLIMVSLTFFTTSLSVVHDLDLRLRDLGSKPVDIYPKWLKVIFFTVVPVAFFGSVPASAFQGPSFLLAVYSIFFAFTILCLSRLFFYYSLSHYTSAGG